MVNIPGFSHICKHKTKKGGGVSILLHDGITYKHRSDLDIFEEGLTESVFVEIRSKNGKQIIVGSMYKPPNVSIEQYRNNLTMIVNKIKSVTGRYIPEVIIGMDHNMNLLNRATHLPTHNFMETLSNLNLYPTITRPTWITHHLATLIDNIFISEFLHRNFESSILIEDISDHLPLLAMLKQTQLLNTEPLEFESRCLNDKKLKHVNNILATCTENDITIYKSYCNTYNVLKRKLRNDYYRTKCTEF